jgi:ankyrin repeat protein
LNPGFWRDETLEVLLRHGANINALSPDNSSTPLIAALESGRGRKLIQKLLDAGADITLGKVPALFVAIESEDPQATEAVLDAGADVNAVHRPEEPNQWCHDPKVKTPLLAAAAYPKDVFKRIGKPERNNVEGARVATITLLLKRGANPLLELQDEKTTVLHEIAYRHGIIAPILKAGIDLEIKDSEGRTPLLSACGPVDYPYRVTEDNFTPRELILAGANIHATDNAGSTPLHLAVQSGLLETVTLLLEKGATVSRLNNARLARSTTPWSQAR